MELQNETKTPKCEICLMKNQQIKTIFKSLFIHLKSFIRKAQKSLSTQQSKNNHFQRLIKIIMPQHVQLKNFVCQHQVVIYYFTDKLNIKREVFQSLCQKVADKVGRRNYQLQTLINQIKNTELYLQKQFQTGKIQVKRSEKKKFSIVPVKNIQQEHNNQNNQQVFLKKQNEADQKPFISDKTLHSKSSLHQVSVPQQNANSILQKRQTFKLIQTSPSVSYPSSNQFGYIPTFPYNGYSFDPNFNPFWSYK